MNRSVCVADTDALIALTLADDIHHKRASSISKYLLEKGVTVIFPVTVFPETITFLKRAVNQPQKAHEINTQLQNGIYTIEYINQEILQQATQYFEHANSKKNTFFDAIVAATAKSLKADTIFSFDKWYEKLGFTLEA